MGGGAFRPFVAAAAALVVVAAPVAADAVELLEVGFASMNDAAGIDIEDGWVYVSARNDDFATVDVSDPSNPSIGGRASLDGRDVEVTSIGGRRVAVVADHGSGVDVVDVDDRSDPHRIGSLRSVTAHNVAVVEGTPYVYVSRSAAAQIPAIDILDISDPTDPHVETVWRFPPAGPTGPVAPAMSCHDVTVFPAKDRAYCAAHTQTVILDIADPLAPEVLGTISNPAIQIHHWAYPTADHDTLLVGDEAGGANAPACTASQTTGAGTVSAPTGALWVYDISEPAAPVPTGWVSPPTEAAIRCTAHFGDRIAPTTFVVGWYDAGVVAVDVSGPVPTILDQWEGARAWDAKHEAGHVYTGSMDEGVHVLEVS